jgi:enamine deaminase RidA (YjgF/YER057c/UK114 family)
VTRAVALLAAVLALVVTGCGSKPKPVTKAQYEAELQTLGQDLTRAGSSIGHHIDISGFNQDIANFQDHLRAAAKDLHGVKPPANAQAANKRLADSFDELADDFEPVKDARRKSIVEAGKAADIVRKSAAVKNGRAAIDELKAKGYDVGAMGSL